MEFLRSFLRRHLPGKPVEELPNVGCLFRPTQNRPTQNNIRDYKCHDGDDNENVKKEISWIGKTTTRHVHHAFLYISLPSLHDCNGKMPNFTIYGERKLVTAKFSFSFYQYLNMVLRNSTQKEFACLWRSKWVGVIAIEIERTQIHFLSDLFVAVAVVVS